jgi:hypothetical protein
MLGLLCKTTTLSNTGTGCEYSQLLNRNNWLVGPMTDQTKAPSSNELKPEAVPYRTVPAQPGLVLPMNVAFEVPGMVARQSCQP